MVHKASHGIIADTDGKAYVLDIGNVHGPDLQFIQVLEDKMQMSAYVGGTVWAASLHEVVDEVAELMMMLSQTTAIIKLLQTMNKSTDEHRGRRVLLMGTQLFAVAEFRIVIVISSPNEVRGLVIAKEVEILVHL